MRLASELKSKIDTLWDRVGSGGLSNPLQFIEQMSNLIFMKRLEDMDTVEEKRAAAKRQPYTSIFTGHGDCRWSHRKHLSAEQMLIHVRDVVFLFIKTIHNWEMRDDCPGKGPNCADTICAIHTRIPGGRINHGFSASHACGFHEL